MLAQVPCRASLGVKLESRRPFIQGSFVLLARALLLGAVLVTVPACQNTEIQQEARQAEKDGRVINNGMMLGTYPSTFRPGTPAYLERDFEAGADFICDEIKLKYKRDLCADEKIGWRK